MTAKRTVLRMMLLMVCGMLHGCFVATAGQAGEIPPDDYGLYDQIVTTKFLTSDTRLVVLERMTTVRLLPDHEEPMTMTGFLEQHYFDGELPPDLVRDFIGVNQESGRLEGRFRFGVRYRFVSGDALEEPEVTSAIPAIAGRGMPIQALPILDRLAFSRVGRTLRNDQALVLVENMRPDGTGAGFLVWFRRQARDWAIYDTEVAWTVRHQERGEGPLLAP